MVLRRSMPLAGLTLVLLAAGSAPALAADSGFYVGATAGQSLFHQDRNDADGAILDAFSSNGFGVASGSSSLDKTDFAFSGLLGYRVMPGFAIEAAYVDLGKLNYKFSGTVVDFQSFSATANLTAEAKGPTLSALGILPVSPSWEVYGRLGAFFSKVTLTADISVNGLHGSDSESANSVDGLIGVGTAWHLGKNLALRAEYTRFANVGDKDKTGETNIDLFNLGVTYSFN
jgi:opacity protein-like surface antigen